MSDYISREEAIDAVFEAMADGRAIFPVLNNLPAADVRPVVRGKWEKTSKSLYACSECGNCIIDERVSGCFFCPNCGADMREES